MTKRPRTPPLRDPWQPHPARGALLAVGAVGAMIVVALLWGSKGPVGTDAADRASPREARSLDVASTPASGEPSAQPTQAVSTQQAGQAQVDEFTREVREAATAAVAAWQTPDTAARTAALTPLATPEFLQASATIDPTLVPTSPVASSSTVTESDGFARVQVTLVDGTGLLVDLQLATGWLVNSILPEA